MRLITLICLLMLVVLSSGLVSCTDGGDSSSGGDGTASARPAGSGGEHTVGDIGDDSQYATDSDGDGRNEIVAGPDDWPEAIPRYPDSKILHMDTDADGESWGAALFITDRMEPALKFYKQELEENGFRFRSRTEAEGATVEHYDRKDMTVNVGWEENEQGRVITILAMGADLTGLHREDGDGDVDDGSGEAEAEAGDDAGGDTEVYSLSDDLEGFAEKALKPYPGADVTQEITDGNESAMMQNINADGDEVLTFYRKHWEDLGFKQTDNMDMGEMKMIAFKGRQGELSCTLIGTGDGYLATNVFIAGEGEGGGSAASGSGEGSSGDDDVSVTTMQTGSLPEGWPVDVLPQYPGSKIESAAIVDGEYTLLQRSTDADNELIKHYDKLFREAGWMKTASQSLMGTYLVGWEKDGWVIDETCRKDGDGSFISLCYYQK